MEARMSNLVTIFGGSGFVGRYVARRMAKQGWRVRVAVRSPNDALFVRPYGSVGQVEPVFCNIRDDASVAAALKGTDAVVNCVGLLVERGANTFIAVQTEGAARIARLAKAEGVSRLVHFSALGADANSESDYQKTKAAGEAEVLKHFPKATILRPSVIFGSEDTFFNRFAGMSGFAPILPLVGGQTRFQPVYVDDVALAAETAVLGQASGIYELGGPEVDTLHGLVDRMLAEINKRRLVLDLPFWVGRILGGVFDIGSAITLGLFSNNILTRDQVRSLATDNVVQAGAKGLTELGISPTPMATVLPEYLWRFRPSGQYDAIKESAKNLKKA
jgi:uncharacterized protein YbjT (DUF2867 family)